MILFLCLYVGTCFALVACVLGLNRIYNFSKTYQNVDPGDLSYRNGFNKRQNIAFEIEMSTLRCRRAHDELIKLDQIR